MFQKIICSFSLKNGYLLFSKTYQSAYESLEKLRIYKISTCDKGHTAYAGLDYNVDQCPVCQKPNDDANNCHFYYFPIKDRIISLLESDWKRFFMYPKVIN